MTSSSLTPAPRRNPALVTIDVIASVVLLLFGAIVAVTVLANGLAYATLDDTCGAGPYSGLECNGTVLNIVVYGLLAVAVLAFFLAVGMVIISLIRKRYTFWWPILAIVVTVTFFYVGTWVASMTVPA